MNIKPKTAKRFQILQHVDFEGPASIETWILENGHRQNISHLYKNDPLPAHESYDILIIMGGPMSVHDEQAHPFLRREKRFILEAIHAGKRILGLCLGAQLIAAVLGANISKNNDREIGWFQITRKKEAALSFLGDILPEKIEAFHWHGETFSLPPAAIPLFKSEACADQAFIVNERVIGFQFHLETTASSAAQLIENCRSELDASRYVQSEKTMLSDEKRFSTINHLMKLILNKLSE